MASLLAMRQLGRPEIAGFLNDTDELLVVEAARAINDVPIQDAMPQLAAMLRSEKMFSTNLPSQFQAMLVRAVNANFRAGESQNAEALANFTTRENVPESVAVEVLNDLAIWAEPGQRDRVVGIYRPLTGERNPTAAANALAPVMAKILTALIAANFTRSRVLFP